jgi:hypothetical protein
MSSDDERLGRAWNVLLTVVFDVVLSLFAVNGQAKSAGTKWANAELEAADESSDLQIYKSVVQSMEEWKQRKNSSKRC